jgi:hypothetical protein
MGRDYFAQLLYKEFPMKNIPVSRKLTRPVVTGKAMVSRPVLENTPAANGFTLFWRDMPELIETTRAIAPFRCEESACGLPA